MNNNAKVILWGSVIGAVSWLEDREIGVFQYGPDFVGSGIQVSPLMMPLRLSPYEFPALARNTFRGLPGLLADSLPDKYGNAIIDAWLASEAKTAASFHPVDRLCYVGIRGMGALEFQPAILESPSSTSSVEVDKLVRLANKILDERRKISGIFTGEDDHQAINDILRVGTSAGGARAKAILAWNPKTNKFKSGQVDADDNYEYWMMKFDGITSSHDTQVRTPIGYGKIEYAYHLMAIEIGIEMTKCRLHNEGGRNHFMTKRFDRTANGGKIHMQSLGALAHYDYKQPDSYSYEQAIQVIQRLNLTRQDIIQMFLRAVFNVIGRNCDDHVKNIAFLMDRRGKWYLAPAFDISYAWNPNGEWTGRHQMSINGKRSNIKREDLLILANTAGIKKVNAEKMINRVFEVISEWTYYAKRAEVENSQAKKIQLALYTKI